MTKSPQYEHLSAYQRCVIRREIEDASVYSSSSEVRRVYRALARKYGVRLTTLFNLIEDIKESA